MSVEVISDVHDDGSYAGWLVVCDVCNERWGLELGLGEPFAWGEREEAEKAARLHHREMHAPALTLLQGGLA